MRRQRFCIEGDGEYKPCQGESVEEKLCPDHCSPCKIFIFFHENKFLPIIV